jgi:hypothetical protein
LNVSFVFVPGNTAAPQSNAPMNTSENVAGLWPKVFSSLMRIELPDIVGRTVMRTVLLLSGGLVSRTLCDTVHAENQRGS